MTRSLAPLLAISALILAPSAAAAPPGNSSCMGGGISYPHAQNQERDDYAQSTIEAYDAPGRDFYRYNATRTTTECD